MTDDNSLNYMSQHYITAILRTVLDDYSDNALSFFANTLSCVKLQSIWEKRSS